MFDKIPNQEQKQTTDNSPQQSQQPQQPTNQQVPQQTPVQPTAHSSNSHGKRNKLIIILLVVFLLLIGSGALAYYQGWYKMLPFFQEKEQEIKGNLTAMMYERLAQLDGADFELTYSMSVGDRDDDAEVPEFGEDEKINKGEEAGIKANLAALPAAAEVYYDENDKSYEGFCDNNSIAGVKQNVERVGSFKCMDDASHWAASASASEGFWCIDPARIQINVTTEITSNTCTGLIKIEPSPVSKSSELNFLTGEYLEDSWMYVENTIPEDLNVEVKFTGSGFSLASREEGKQNLPDVKVGLFGKAKLSSATFDLGMEAMAVDDDFYYMISDFPIMDITKGHMDEWIKMSPEDSWMSDIVPEYDEEQKQAVERFRNFIADTQKYNVLSFSQTDKVLEMNGRQVNLFNVSVNAENIPEWLEEARKIALESAKDKDLEELSFLGLEKDKMTDEDKKKLVEDVNKAMKNIKISIGIDMEKGDLMMVDMTARFIPPASSEKFKDKQFNFIANLKLTNHNNPPAIVAPEVYVDQEEIEQEELGMTDEQYQDYKQARRVVKVREELLKYYKENREFPVELSMVTRLIKDRNTGQDFKYTAEKGNFKLTYSMNTDITESEEEKSDVVPDIVDWGMGGINDYNSPEYKLKHAMGSDYTTRVDNLWHDGENVADRYSLITDQMEDSNNLLIDAAKNNNYNNVDVLQALNQSKIVKQTKNLLKEHFRENKKYPDSILDLKEKHSYFSLYNFSGYICEDLNTGAYCDYSVTQDGMDYEIKISFPLSYNVISKDIYLNSYDYEENFVEGENIFTSQIVVDSDKDGLNDRDEEKYGTDKYNYDTDGDGYSDGEEVANGYDPLENVNSEEGNLLLLEDASYWLRGDVDAPITIMVYSDYDCPFCQRHHDTMKSIIEEYKGDVKWIHRHFPLSQLHPDAEYKAEAAECIGELGGNDAFWQFTDYLYGEKPALDNLASKVEELGYNKASWQICMEDNRFESIINSQIAEATEAGARGTPYSLIIHEGKTTPINGALPYEQIKAQIDNLL